MGESGFDVVTGAFGYSGRYIARLLAEKGRRVKTLTGHPDRPNPFAGKVEAAPFNFDNHAALVESLRGADVLYNTYWVRFGRGRVTFDQAVEHSRALISAAAEAGVRRFVHISIASPSADSPFSYYRGKAAVEKSLVESGMSHAILRPTVLFGAEDILINNIAWMLRRLPVFGVFGDGQYGIQPVHVQDVAALAVEMGEHDGDVVVDAVGPEAFAFDDLLALIKKAIGARCRVMHLRPWMAFVGSRMIGRVMKDVIITREEVGGLMAGLLVSRHPPMCPTRLSAWLGDHAHELGTGYRSELARHFAGWSVTQGGGGSRRD